MDIYQKDPHLAVSAWVYFMANEWSLEVTIDIYGPVLGRHFWDKWCLAEREHPDRSTMRLYYAMTAENRRKLVDRAMRHYATGTWISSQ